jgi:membrane protein DedA with SNARE-associated domain
MIEEFVLDYGLLAIFVLMAANGLFSAPPSEVILPLAGILAQQSNCSLFETIFAASLGNLAGTSILYFIGWHYGLSPILSIRQWLVTRKLAARLVSRILPSEKQLNEFAVKFSDEGAYLVGLLRCAPYIRSIISLPAGFVRMPKSKFLSFSMAGIVIWATGWQILGYALGETWDGRTPLTRLIGVFLLIVVCFIFWRNWQYFRDRFFPHD